ncbi:hypothetical protein ACVWZM_004154 [Bradyrhizobium sp. USDA 4501]
MRHIDRRAAGARAQLADMRQNAQTFQQNIDEARNRYTKEELEAFRADNFTPALIEKIRIHTMEMAQQFFENHPNKPGWPPKDDIFHTFELRFALCATFTRSRPSRAALLRTRINSRTTLST